MLFNQIKNDVQLYEQELLKQKQAYYNSMSPMPLVIMWTCAEYDALNYFKKVQEISTQEEYSEYLLNMPLRKYIHIYGIMETVGGGIKNV